MKGENSRVLLAPSRTCGFNCPPPRAGEHGGFLPEAGAVARAGQEGTRGQANGLSRLSTWKQGSEKAGRRDKLVEEVTRSTVSSALLSNCKLLLKTLQGIKNGRNMK